MMRKITVFLLTIMLFVFVTNFSSVYANETTDLRNQATDEYYARRYGYSTYFYEETIYYLPPIGQRLRSEPEKYKQVKIYQHQSPSGVPTIGEWQVQQITPWVDFVPGATISASSGTSTTHTTSWSVTAGIEIAVFKEIVKASGSVTYETSYSKTYHQEHGIVADYNFARSVLGTSSGYTDYAIVFKQGMGQYKTFNYEGSSVVWHFTIFHGAKDAINTWYYRGIGYFTAPLEGITYTKYSVVGTTF
jgi:hypothetical protein